ncbi:hypothetical protein ACFLSX_01450 [Calditrichota bacterium]
MDQRNINVKSKPRHTYFHELIDEALHALNQLKVIEIPRSRIEAVKEEFKTSKIKPAHGSLRFDKDANGQIFLQEFRPVSMKFKALKHGYFCSIKSERPFWEIVGTHIIRVNRKRRRYLENIAQNVNKPSSEISRYCLIMQSGLTKDFIKTLLEQGRVSFSTQKDFLKEGPLYSALSIISKLTMDQVVETNAKNGREIKNEVLSKLSGKGNQIKEIACVIGRTNRGDYYTSIGDKDNQFPVKIWNDKAIPVNIASEITFVENSLLKDRNLLVLNKLTLPDLVGYLHNRPDFNY